MKEKIIRIHKSNLKKKKILVENLANGLSITQACQNAGIDRRTYYNWSQDPNIRKEIEEAKDSRLQIVEDALYKKAVEGNPTCLIFYLCNRAPEKWKSILKTEHKIEDIDKILDSIAQVLKPEKKTKKNEETD